MGNVFPPNKDIHEVYDLKGSTVGRAIGDDEIKNNPRAVMKDLNWIAKNKTVNLGPAKRMPFCEQIERDVAVNGERIERLREKSGDVCAFSKPPSPLLQYLKEQNIMDYSLLIGIHDMIKGNKEHIREKSLSVFEVSGSSVGLKNPYLYAHSLFILLLH